MFRDDSANDRSDPKIELSEMPREQRISMALVLEELRAFFSLEKGSLYTTRKLGRTPTQAITDYLAGDRSRLTNPLRYLFMSCALTTAALVFLVPGAASQWSVDSSERTQAEITTEDPQLAEQLEEAKRLLSELSVHLEDRTLRSNAKAANAHLEKTAMSRLGEISGSWMNVFLLLSVPIYTAITFSLFYRARFLLPEHVAIH
ncbi:MAG TPA: hypothetical protein DDW52_26880 [Planctomycetaceae bacterium]|nr:hypothetical protein [Planctomycetaceae bacterium]